MFSLKNNGKFTHIERFLNSVSNKGYLNVLDKYGRQGVEVLSSATPIESGKTASSWTYDIEHNGETTSIVFSNTNVNNGVNIALILQLGHGTGTGGYVAGRDYINPAIQPIFDSMVGELWREVTSL